jgi:MFS family permease
MTYMTIIPYLQNSSDLLQTKYHFDKVAAGFYFGIPNIVSACASPPLGILIDKIGKRAILCCVSSIILIIAFSSSMNMPECYQCKNELFPLVLLGCGASIYSAVIWASIPYVVKESTLGTAFGVTTAIQNTGLVIAPSLVGLIRDRTMEVDHGYYYTNMLFVAINMVGLVINFALYTIDIYQNDGILDKVAQNDTPTE